MNLLNSELVTLREENTRISIALENQVIHNHNLMQEMKIFAKTVVRVQREKDQKIDNLQLQLKSNKVLDRLFEHYKAKCLTLEIECKRLQKKLDTNLEVIKLELYEQIFITNQDYELIEQLNQENQHLRSLLMLHANLNDNDSIQNKLIHQERII